MLPIRITIKSKAYKIYRLDDIEIIVNEAYEFKPSIFAAVLTHTDIFGLLITCFDDLSRVGSLFPEKKNFIFEQALECPSFNWNFAGTSTWLRQYDALYWVPKMLEMFPDKKDDIFKKLLSVSDLSRFEIKTLLSLFPEKKEDMFNHFVICAKGLPITRINDLVSVSYLHLPVKIQRYFQYFQKEKRLFSITLLVVLIHVV